MVSAIALCVLLVMLAWSGAGALGAKVAKPSTGARICKSIECVALAAGITSKMNVSADPCEDFYNYACGNFPNIVKYNPARAFHRRLPRDYYLFQDSFSSMEERLKQNVYELFVLDNVVDRNEKDMNDLYNLTRLFFRSCSQWMRMNDDSGSRFANYNSSVSFLKDTFSHLIQEIKPTEGQSKTLESVLAILVRTGVESMLTVTLPSDFAEKVLLRDFNMTNVTRAIINVKAFAYSEQPDLRPYIQFFTKNKISAPLTLARQAETFANILSELRLFMNDSSWIEGCPVQPSQQHAFTVRDLDVLSQCALPDKPFSWKAFFEELLQTGIDEGALVSVPEAAATISFVSYFKRQPMYSGLTSQLSEHVSLLVFDWLLSFAPFFPRELYQTWQLNRVRALRLERPKGDIIDGCMMWTRLFLQPIVERMYQTAYHPENFRDVRTLVQAIQDASIKGVTTQTWITESAKEAIAKKIQSVKQSIGFDQLTTDQLKQFYASTLLSFRESKISAAVEHSFGSLLSIALCAYARRNFDVMSGNSPVTIFLELNPLVVNAFNFLERNQIIFPMAILAPPVYHVNYPTYINLGSLGYIIGHEIGHSFDNEGHEMNRLGAVGHFWDNETEAGYMSRMECVRNCYGNYSLYPGGPTHKSNTSLGNDISDIMGIRAAFGALQLLKRQQRPMPSLPNLPQQFTAEQLFFIQAAQGWCFKSENRVLLGIFGGGPSHSPHHLRVRGIAQNSREFAATFGCRAGQSMAPERRCEFW